MATMTGMDPEAADAEAERSPDPAQHAASALDAELLARLVAQAVAAQSRPRRSALLTGLATTIVAGLIAVAAAGYTALRADITALHAEINGVETSLRAEIQDFRAEVNATLLDHTDRLARLETTSQQHTEQLTHLETTSQQHTEQLAHLKTTSQQHTEQLTRLEAASQFSQEAQSGAPERSSDGVGHDSSATDRRH